MMNVLIDISEYYNEVQPYFKPEVIDGQVKHAIDLLRLKEDTSQDGKLRLTLMTVQEATEKLEAAKTKEAAVWGWLLRFTGQVLAQLTLELPVAGVKAEDILGFTRKDHFVTIECKEVA